MPRFLLFVLLTGFAPLLPHAHAQYRITATTTVQYEGTIQLNQRKEYACMLYLNNDQALFQWFKGKGDFHHKFGHIESLRDDRDSTFQFQNFATRQILSLERLQNNEVYTVAQPLPSFNWVVSPDNKVIEGFSCQKATGQYSGRTYTAWFTTQIPVQAGPWKLQGAPGLILEAFDASGEIWFTANKVQQAANQPAGVAFTGQEVTVAQFYERKVALMARKESMTLPNANGTDSLATRPTINFLEKEYEVRR